jgi:hypothetical protein
MFTFTVQCPHHIPVNVHILFNVNLNHYSTSFVSKFCLLMTRSILFSINLNNHNRRQICPEIVCQLFPTSWIENIFSEKKNKERKMHRLLIVLAVTAQALASKTLPDCQIYSENVKKYFFSNLLVLRLIHFSV